MVVRSEFPTTMADSDLSEVKSHILTGACLSNPLFLHLFHTSTLGDEPVFMYRHSNTADGKWDDSHDTVTFTVHSVFASFGQERRRGTYVRYRVTRRDKPSHTWRRSKPNGSRPGCLLLWPGWVCTRHLQREQIAIWNWWYCH